MTIASRTPEGSPNRCPVCGHWLRIEPSVPPGDAPCPRCGSLLWFAERILGDEIDALIHDAILPDLRATDKNEAIREIVARLAAVGAVGRDDVEEIVDAVLHREVLGSTGIGRGFAVPHAEHRSVDRVIGAMALSRSGIEFNSLDQRPVNTIFLFVSPGGRRKEHFRALERISRHLRRLQAED